MTTADPFTKAERILWLDKRGEPVITTTANGKRNALRWGWTPAVAIAEDFLATDEHLQEVADA